MKAKDFTKYKFFVKPCFICKNMTWESDGDGYSSYSYAYCEYIENSFEKTKKFFNFPYCESPKKCTRKKIFHFNRDFDHELECTYFGNLHQIEDFIGVKWEDEFENHKRHLARKIAYSVSYFHEKMIHFRKIKDF